MVSDTNDTIVQLVYGVRENPQPYYNCKTDSMETYILYANLPIVTSRTQSYSGATAVPNYNGSAIFVRVITTGNVTIVKGSLASSRGWNPFF
jgi:hypothetical protein